MAKKSNLRYFFFVILCLLPFSFLLYGLYLAVRTHGVASSEAAGWTQALGAVLAIAGGFVAVERQLTATAKANREREMEARAHKADVINTLLGELHQFAVLTELAFATRDAASLNSFQSTILMDYLGALTAIPTLDLPSGSIAVPILRLRDDLRTVSSQLSNAFRGVRPVHVAVSEADIQHIFSSLEDQSFGDSVTALRRNTESALAVVISL